MKQLSFKFMEEDNMTNDSNEKEQLVDTLHNNDCKFTTDFTDFNNFVDFNKFVKS